jgi:hypothetical protein
VHFDIFNQQLNTQDMCTLSPKHLQVASLEAQCLCQTSILLLLVHLQRIAASGGVLLKLEVIQLHAKHAKQAIAKLLQLRLG